MKLHLTSAYPDEPQPVGRWRELAALASDDSAHTVVDDPDAAELILFAENSHYGSDPLFSQLLRHPLVRSRPTDCYMYNEHDRPWCVLPGLYSAMPRSRFCPDRIAPVGYVQAINTQIEETPREPDRVDLLYSFLGAANCRVRHRILAQPSDATRYIKDTTRSFSPWAGGDTDAREQGKREFAAVLARSRYVLCPRGAGVSSYRMYEAMQAGRAPVVLSDQWVAPVGPDWSFLLRVPERAVDRLPETLRADGDGWRERGQQARREWERWFAPEVLFGRMLDTLAELHARRTTAGHPRCPRLSFTKMTYGASQAIRSVVRRLRGRR